MRNIINTILVYPILNFAVILYHFFGNNLALAIMAIAIIVRLLVIPSTRKQLKMAQTMSKMKPEMDKLQKLYGNNQEKLAQEQLKLYKKFNYNPIGCFFGYIPVFVMLFVVLQVIRVISSSQGIAPDGLYASIAPWAEGGLDHTVNFFGRDFDLALSFNQLMSADTYQGFLKSVVWVFTAPFKSIDATIRLVFAVLVGVVQFFVTVVMQYFQSVKQNVQNQSKKLESKASDTKSKNKAQVSENPLASMDPQEMQKKMSKIMNLIFPFLTFTLALQYPSALALYWLTQSLVMIFEYVFMNFAQVKVLLAKIFNRSAKVETNKEGKKESKSIESDSDIESPVANKKKKKSKKDKKKVQKAVKQIDAKKIE